MGVVHQDLQVHVGEAGIRREADLAIVHELAIVGHAKAVHDGRLPAGDEHAVAQHLEVGPAGELARAGEVELAGLDVVHDADIGRRAVVRRHGRGEDVARAGAIDARRLRVVVVVGGASGGQRDREQSNCDSKR